ncbi:MAG: DDE-type integrase/transposase/recombinase [Sedimentisphaerales bacterium]|nr:DDE-type integrase/transposase/recombinase [Sedimentisphaerales bacterium]
MNKLTNEKRCQVIASLVEGNSIRATVRMTRVAKNTITKLLAEVGAACWEYQDKVLRNLNCNRIQCDEIWSFCYSKQKNVPSDKQAEFGYGDVWTWTAMDAHTKLVPCWLVGLRDADYAYEFMHNLALRVSNRIQLTTHGHKVYLDAVDDAFAGEIDYAMLVKIYGAEQPNDTKFSPPSCVGTQQVAIVGDPNRCHVFTSFIERQNLTMRMCMRRFTRLTNAFSKKIENLQATISLHFMYYNFCRIHQSLRITPAMAASVSGHLWEISEIVDLFESN